jgi:BirA family biotin operon repressor/biotin-[acetyl-CoA-carboxylase] ligase
MLSGPELSRAVRAAGVEAPPVWLDEVDSTNRVARELAERDAPAWTVVAAGHQTAGRGRLGRTWVDRPGDALMFSVIVRPPPSLTPDRAGLLTLAAGVAGAEACRAVSGRDVGCKWPNDLVDAVGKVGGVLAESRVDRGALAHAVVGVGINLTAPPDVPGAAGLGPVDGGRLLETMLRRLRLLVDAPDDVLDAYRPLCVTIGLPVRATTTDGRVVEGTATGVGADGSLIVDGASSVAFGEVEHLRRDGQPG